MRCDVSQAASDLIAQKRAEIVAKIAAMKKGAPASAAPTPSPAPTPAAPRAVSSQSASPAPVDDLSRRVAEAKRRVADAQSKLAVKDNPYMVSLRAYIPYPITLLIASWAEYATS